MDQPTDKAAPYRVLARKYRPADFTQLIGQEPMVRTLTNAFASGRVAQAWMLTGVRGVGKTTTARILARALNYKTEVIDQPTIDLSMPGEHCEAIMEGRHVDVIEMDAASHTGIDDIKQIIDGVRYSPVAARYKVYIIDEIHMLSDKAFNALLKTLEEPPPHAKFIFATTEIRKVPITVLSRCQRFDLRRIEPDEMTKHLKSIAEKEKVESSDAALALIARAGEGSVRDALSIMDQAISHGSGAIDAEAVRSMLGLADRARIVDLFEHVMSGRVAEALAEFREQYDAGADPVVVLTDLAEFTHLVTRLRYVPEAAQSDVSLSPEERERGLAFSQKLPVTVLARAWQMLLKGIPEVELAARPVAAADMVLIRLGHAATLPTLDDALKKLESAPSAPVQRELSSSQSTPAKGGGAAQAVAQPQSQPSHDASGQTLMSMRDNGNAVRLVASQPDEQQALQPAPPPAEPAAQVLAGINSLQDLADLAEKNRDPMMRAKIRKFVRLVRIDNGQLTIGVTQDAPATLAGEMSGRMREWFGRPLMVVVTQEPGGFTMEEEDRRQRDEMLADAGRDPTISAVLAAFPGAKIVDVRLGEAAAEDDMLVEAELVDPDDVPVDPDEE